MGRKRKEAVAAAESQVSDNLLGREVDPNQADAPEPEPESEPDPEAGEQLMLLDVESEFARPLKAAARKYKKSMAARKAALAEEVEAKKSILDLVKEAMATESGIRADAEGVIQFAVDGMTIRIKPRDELVKVKFEDDEE